MMPQHSAHSNSNEFLNLHQRGYRRRAPNPNAFVALPNKLVDQIGLTTNMGVRVDVATLSTFTYYAQKSLASSELSVSGKTVVLPPGEFALSILRVAENLWARWFHLPSDNEQFDRFYQRIRKVVGRLKDRGLIRWVSWLDDDDKRTRGSVWTLTGTKLDWFLGSLPTCEGSMVTVMRSAREDYDQGEVAGFKLTNVVDLIGSAFVSENLYMFTRAEACYSVYDRGLYLNSLSYMNAVAQEGAAGARFISVGSVRHEDIGKSNPASFLYWFVLDIDRVDPFDAFDDTREILYQLDEYGVPLDDVIVSYTGGKGYHIRIPSGMFDNPVFKSVKHAQKVITDMFNMLIDIEVDSKVFDPRQLIRIVGSKRSTGSDYSIYTRAFSGEEFLGMSFQSCLEISKSYEPVHLPDPRTVGPVSDLVMSLVAASDAARQTVIPKFSRKNELSNVGALDGSVVKAALGGVGEGEEWHKPVNGKCYVGRNYAMFIGACGLLRDYEGDEITSLEALQTVNYNNDPPLPDREIRGCLASAKRRLVRDGQLR